MVKGSHGPEPLIAATAVNGSFIRNAAIHPLICRCHAANDWIEPHADSPAGQNDLFIRQFSARSKRIH